MRRWYMRLAATLLVLLLGAGPVVHADMAEPTVAKRDPLFRVTLVTGDQVLVFTDHNGDRIYTPVPVRRPGGMETAFYIRRIEGETYVVPADLLREVGQRLDPLLFNIDYLVSEGYDDASLQAIPLVAERQRPNEPLRAFDRAPGVVEKRELPLVHGLAFKVEKKRSADFARALLLPPPSALHGPPAALQGIQMLWLDRKYHVRLDEALPAVQGEAAHQNGFDGRGIKIAVLDTGIDSTHPDLKDRVIAARDFTDDNDPADLHGHGTHVASIAAGSGAASGGRYTGVTPAASLINAKVLNRFGWGFFSGIIDGMDWAISQGAQVINMSLGTAWASDGKDALSQTVDNLAASKNVIFAIAAGNSGQRRGIGSPGAASAAITMGAV